MKFFIKNFSSKYDQIRSFLQIWNSSSKELITLYFLFFTKKSKVHKPAAEFQTEIIYG